MISLRLSPRYLHHSRWDSPPGPLWLATLQGQLTLSPSQTVCHGGRVQEKVAAV